MVREAPRIETDRLVLRPWRKDDFRTWLEIMHQPEVHRHFGPEPSSAEDVWRRLCASVGMWQFLGFGGWAVQRRADARLLGNVGLFNAWRDFEPEFGEQPEMGWIFSSEVHGQGIAGEACRAALSWAEDNLEPTPVWAIIAPENQPSIKLAERLGFEAVGNTSYNDEPTLVLKRPAWA